MQKLYLSSLIMVQRGSMLENQAEANCFGGVSPPSPNRRAEREQTQNEVKKYEPH